MGTQSSYSTYNFLTCILLLCVCLFFSGCIDNSIIATFTVAQNVIDISSVNVALSVSYSLNSNTTVTVSVHNRARQLVNILVDSEAQQRDTPYSYAWDARNSRGDLVRAGYYYLLLSTPRAQRTVAVYLSENL